MRERIKLGQPAEEVIIAGESVARCNKLYGIICLED